MNDTIGAKDMKPKTSEWVAELLESWLGGIEDPEILDQFVKQIAHRKHEIWKTSEDRQWKQLMKSYRELPQGTVLYTLKPIHNAQSLPRKPWHFYTCKLWSWHPRKKTMWVEVKWGTTTKKWGRNFINLNYQRLEILQPSRTEPDVRRRAMEGTR